MASTQISPEQNPGQGLSPQETLRKLTKNIRVLHSMEYQCAAYQQELRQFAQELRLAGLSFVVELTYPTPEADACIIFDEEVIEERPATFTATGVGRSGAGQTLFVDDQTGHMLHVSGDNFELSLLETEPAKQLNVDLTKQLGQTSVKLAVLNGPAVLPLDKTDWHWESQPKEDLSVGSPLTREKARELLDEGHELGKAFWAQRDPSRAAKNVRYDL